jgi:hypothetical protein
MERLDFAGSRIGQCDIINAARKARPSC